MVWVGVDRRNYKKGCEFRTSSETRNVNDEEVGSVKKGVYSRTEEKSEGGIGTNLQ